MSEEPKEPISAERLDELMIPGEFVHTFVNPRSSVLIGADWPRKELLAKARAHGAEMSGPEASAMGHGAVVWSVQNGDRFPLFVQTQNVNE